MPITGRAGVETLLAEAMAAVQADDLETARSILARVVSVEPTMAKAWINYGGVCGELGLEDEAVRAFETAKALEPGSREAISNLGVARRESGRLEEAEGLFREVITIAPDFIFSYYNLAHTLFLAGRFGEAAEAYRAGLKRDPAKTGHQNARLAWALAAAGDRGQAGRELRRALGRIPATETQAMLDEACEVLGAIEAAQPESASLVRTLRRIVEMWAGGSRPTEPVRKSDLPGNG